MSELLSYESHTLPRLSGANRRPRMDSHSNEAGTTLLNETPPSGVTFHLRGGSDNNQANDPLQ